MTQTEKFVASNGRTVDRGCEFWEVTPAGGVMVFLGDGTMDALREFFQYERDTELGVWRWISPTGKDYLVRKLGYGDKFRVVREEHMEQLDWRPEEYNNVEMYRTTEMVKAIRAYLAAHPEPKPWHDAKPGEVWLFKPKLGKPVAFMLSTDNLWINQTGFKLESKYTEDRPYGESHDPNFVPRQIWPEED